MATRGWDRGAWWCSRPAASVEVAGRPVPLRVPRKELSDDPDRDRSQLQHAAARALRIQERWSVLAEALVAEMYPLDADWTPEQPVSRAELVSLMAIESVVIDRERTSIYVKVGELFIDHAVDIRLDREGDIREITLS